MKIIRATFRRLQFWLIRLTTRWLNWQMAKAGLPQPGQPARPHGIRTSFLPRTGRR